MNNIEALKHELEIEEGKREGAYKDTEGKWTIGIGHLLNEQTDAELEILGLDDDLPDYEGFVITEEQIYRLLDHDIQETMGSLRNAFSDEILESLEPKRFMAAFQMAYQIGSVTGFPSFCAAVREGRWEDAANEMMWRDGTKKAIRSRWYTQTPNRCQKMADLMQYGAEDPTVPVSEDPLAGFSQEVLNENLAAFSDADIVGEMQRRFSSIISKL